MAIADFDITGQFGITRNAIDGSSPVATTKTTKTTKKTFKV